MEQNETVSDLAEAVATVSSLNVGQAEDRSNTEISSDESENSPSQMLDPGGKSSTEEFRAEQWNDVTLQRAWTQARANKGHFLLRVGFCSTVIR